jgi:ribosomal protein S18 acetylase RimI-like enzyme
MDIDYGTTDRLHHAAQLDLIKLLASTSPTSLLWVESDLYAALVPSAPHSPIANMAIAPTGDVQAPALTRLHAALTARRITASHIWVPTPDHHSHRLLRAHGYVHHSTVPAMTLNLDDTPIPDPEQLDCDDRASVATLGRLNAIAYPDGQGLALALAVPPTPDLDLRVYQARLDGEIAAVMCAIDRYHPHLGFTDCGLQFLTTHPRARRRGLARRLFCAVLRDAHARGCATSTIHAGPAGVRLYIELGYQHVALVTIFQRNT